MKTIKQTLALIVLTVFCASTGFAAETIAAGPKGGRLLQTDYPRPEFFVEKDRTVTITFYDANLKPVPPTTQTVTVIAEPKSGKETLDFEKKGDALVSRTPLPEGEGYNVVVQVKAKPDARPQNFRIKFDTHTCGECKRAEYACICGH
jgi:hypothetical protein